MLAGLLQQTLFTRIKVDLEKNLLQAAHTNLIYASRSFCATQSHSVQSVQLFGGTLKRTFSSSFQYPLAASSKLQRLPFTCVTNGAL